VDLDSDRWSRSDPSPNGRRSAEHTSATPPQTPSPAPAPPTDWHGDDRSRFSLSELEKLVARAEAGDRGAIAAFQQFLDNDGSAAWREAGDLAAAAEKTLATKVYAGKKALALSVRRRFQELRKQLSEDNATPLEKLAIDRVILAFMFACAVDFVVASEGEEGLASEKRLKAQAHADKRVQAALKSLQTAREISRGAVAGPLRLWSHSRPQSAASAPLTATG